MILERMSSRPRNHEAIRPGTGESQHLAVWWYDRVFRCCLWIFPCPVLKGRADPLGDKRNCSLVEGQEKEEKGILECRWSGEGRMGYSEQAPMRATFCTSSTLGRRLEVGQGRSPERGQEGTMGKEVVRERHRLRPTIHAWYLAGVEIPTSLSGPQLLNLCPG